MYNDGYMGIERFNPIVVCTYVVGQNENKDIMVST